MLNKDELRDIYDAFREHGAKFRSQAEVDAVDKVIQDAVHNAIVRSYSGAAVVDPPPIVPPASISRKISQKGVNLIHAFEECRLQSYPDPGSKDGHPWTIGWGSTGSDIKKGLTWTQVQADERFARDIAKFEKIVDDATRDVPTNQNQFDAMVSLCYNIGPGRRKTAQQKEIAGFLTSTVLKKHRAGEYLAAARAFLLWNKNDGQVMRGLTRRRLAEADLYDD